MFEIVGFCVKLSLFVLALMVWLFVLVVTTVGYTVHFAVTKGEGGQGWIEAMRDFNRFCDGVMRSF